MKKGQNIWGLIYQEKFSFLLTFFIVFLLTFSTLYLFGFVPEEFKSIIGRYPGKEYTVGSGQLPMLIQIPKIDVNVQIYNPSTTTLPVLNDYLTKGAVHYPGSGLLGGNGNMYIFGHSSTLSVVHNQAYKAFNNIQHLVVGDTISVFSENAEYVYKVKVVKKVDANKELVEFKTDSRMLTLSTCDLFGVRSDRFVVEAEFAYKK